MFFDKTLTPVPLEDTFRGQTCFLIAGGPSLTRFDLTKLRQPGICTFGINNSPKVFRPNLWTAVDEPSNFIKSIWLDPTIMKFAPDGKINKHLWDNERWRESRQRVKDCPNVYYYKRNNEFHCDTFLYEDTINWGNHTDRCHCGYRRPSKDEAKAKGEKRVRECPECGGKTFGARTVFLSALRIVNLLGFNKVFLVGADFSMDKDHKYAWEQDRSNSSIKNNSNTYRLMCKRCDELRPYFEKERFYVWNCLPIDESTAKAKGFDRPSGLTSFDWIDFDLAVRMALKANDFPDTKTERAHGLYDRKAKEEEAKKRREKEKKRKKRK